MNSLDYSIDKKRNLVREKVPIVTVTLDSSDDDDEQNDVEVNDKGTETGNYCSLEFVKPGLGPQGPVQSSSSSSNKTKKTIVTIDLTDGDEEITEMECGSDLDVIMRFPTTAVSPASELEQISDENLAKSSQINEFILPPPPSFADTSAADNDDSENPSCAGKDVKDQQQNEVCHASGDSDQWVENTDYSPSSPAHDQPTGKQYTSLPSPESVNFGAAENTLVKAESQIKHTNEIGSDIIIGDGQLPAVAQTATAGTSQSSSFSSLVPTLEKLTTTRTGTQTQTREQFKLKTRSMALHKTRQLSKKLQEHQQQQQLQPPNDEAGRVKILSNRSIRSKTQITEKSKFCRSGIPLNPVNITRGIRPTKFRCPLCNKEFADKYYFQEHENTHSGKKAFQCQFCQRKYYHRSSKYYHQRTCRMKAK